MHRNFGVGDLTRLNNMIVYMVYHNTIFIRSFIIFVSICNDRGTLKHFWSG